MLLKAITNFLDTNEKNRKSQQRLKQFPLKNGNYRTEKYSNWKSTDLIDSIVEDRINELRASQQNWFKLNRK